MKRFYHSTTGQGMGLLLVALIMGLVLSGTAFMGHRSADQLTEVAVVGQAEALMRAISRGHIGSAPDNQVLEELLEENEDLGLRYIGVIDAQGVAMREAGEPADRDFLHIARGRGENIIRVGDRFRLIKPLGRGRGMMMRRMRMTNEHLVMEFKPTLLNRMKLRSALTFAVGFAASVLLMGTAVIFWRLNRRTVEAEHKLQKQQKLAALGEMSAVLAHEIRNPLGALKGHAQLLEEALPEDSAERDKAARVVEDAVRLQTLSNELLDFVRYRKLKVAKADPGEILVLAAEVCDAARVEVDVSAAPKVWPLDTTRFGQVLSNIIRNGLQASPPDEKVQAAAKLEGDSLVITVRDRGQGIPPGDETRIFEPFHTTRTRGVGLGLAVARQIVEAHGGTIAASNHPDGGAVFTLTLPARGQR